MWLTALSGEPVVQQRHRHLTFVLFTGPIKERKHLGAAIAAVVAVGGDDVSELLQLQLALAPFRPPPGTSDSTAAKATTFPLRDSGQSPGV